MMLPRRHSIRAHSPEQVNYYRGKIYALGLHAEGDIKLARKHFERAAKNGLFARSDAWIEYLERQQPRQQ